MIYVKLFWEFFKTGLFAVGGGMATLPFLQAIGENSGWYSYTDLISESFIISICVCKSCSFTSRSSFSAW